MKRNTVQAVRARHRAHAMSDYALAHDLRELAELEADPRRWAVLLEASHRLELELAVEVAR